MVQIVLQVSTPYTHFFFEHERFLVRIVYFQNNLSQKRDENLKMKETRIRSYFLLQHVKLTIF